nr:proteoglycan 4-like [Cavia porcellus]
MPSKARSCHHPPARESGPAGSSHPAPAPAPAPAHLPGLGPQEGRSLLAALQDHSQPKNCPFMDQRTHCGQEEHPRRPTELASPPGMTPGNTSHDSDKNESSFLGDQPETGILASRETSAVGTVREDTVPLAGTQKAPRVATPMAPQASAPAPRNKTAELTTLDEEGSRAPPACPCATVGEGLSQALAPSGPSMHRVGAAAGETLDPVQHQASTWVPPVVHPEDTAHPHQALTAPSLCAPNNSGASNPRASTGDKDIHATEQDTLHHGVTSQKLATRHSQESPRWPCTEPPSGTVRSSIHATGPAPTGEAWLTQPAPEHPAPDQQAEPRAVPQAKRSGPTPASLGPPEGHHGPVCSQQAGQSDDPQTMAMPLGGQGVREFELKPWAAKKLAGSEKPATREEPGPVGTQVEEHPPGPRIRQVGSLAWGNGTRTAESPVTQDRGQARGPAPQASVQPSSTAKGASTANREPSVPAPSTGTQGNPGIGRPSRGDESAVTCPPEPMHSPTLLTPDLRSHQDPQPQPETGAERDWPDFQRQRRLAHFTKYKAQSFSDQKAFDLSFRPMILRASDTFEAPK